MLAITLAKRGLRKETKPMASNPIKDSAVLREAGKLVETEQVWDENKHMKLIWNLFRTELGYQPLEGAKANMVAKWNALWSNGRLAYSSNCAKGLVDAGICSAPKAKSAASTDGME